MISQELDGVVFRLKENHDFRWVNGFGRVFAAFDEQDSGNIAFGVDGGVGKLFIKYAGAKPVEYSGEPDDAILRLSSGIRNYTDLRHPYLVELVEAKAIGEGFAAVFEWFGGESLHPHWLFTPEEKYTNPASPNYRFERLPISKKLDVFMKVLDFHCHVEGKGYVAIDFYDGSLMYDFAAGDMRICDIDQYEPGPYVNGMGRMWGSSRFMSPEEFLLGALIDGVTNVFNMGATAFCLMGGSLDRSEAKWMAGDALYKVALKAVSPEREERFPSVAELRSAWMKAL